MRFSSLPNLSDLPDAHKLKDKKYLSMPGLSEVSRLRQAEILFDRNITIRENVERYIGGFSPSFSEKHEYIMVDDTGVGEDAGPSYPSVSHYSGTFILYDLTAETLTSPHRGEDIPLVGSVSASCFRSFSSSQSSRSDDSSSDSFSDGTGSFNDPEELLMVLADSIVTIQHPAKAHCCNFEPL